MLLTKCHVNEVRSGSTGGIKQWKRALTCREHGAGIELCKGSGGGAGADAPHEAPLGVRRIGGRQRGGAMLRRLRGDQRLQRRIRGGLWHLHPLRCRPHLQGAPESPAWTLGKYRSVLHAHHLLRRNQISEHTIFIKHNHKNLN